MRGISLVLFLISLFFKQMISDYILIGFFVQNQKNKQSPATVPHMQLPFLFSFWLSNVSKDIESSIFYYLVDRNGIWYSECSTLYVKKRIQLLSPWRFNDVYVGQEDPSQVFLLAGVWLLFLGFGSSACLIPVIYSIGHAYQDAFSSGYYYSSQPSQFLAILNGMLFMALGSVIGYPIASASGNNLLSSYWYISI